MFCQKCGEHIPDGEGRIVGDRLLCEGCAAGLVKLYCQRCGCELPPRTDPQDNGKLLCEKCARLPDDSAEDEPFRGGDGIGQKIEKIRMLPVWLAAVLLVVVVGAVAGLFATKTLCFHEWQPATCTEPEFCLKCGNIRGEPLPHRWKEADCLEPRTCMLCGAQEGEPLGHDWLAATCTDPEICSRCGEQQGEPAGHQWEPANCEHPMRCTVCGQENGEIGDHQWNEATCEEPETCEICGAKRGKPRGHSWNKATCTKPKTCKTCGKTEGDANGHQWKAATIAAPKTCTVCGETEGEPLSMEGLRAIDLMQVTKADFIKATGDAHHEEIGCGDCSDRSSTLVSDSFPGCVLAFGSASDACPEHIHVFKGYVTDSTYVGMTYDALQKALGDPSWKLNEGDMSVTAWYTIGGQSVGFVFTDKRLFRDIIASQISFRPKVTVKDTNVKVASARIG